MRQADLPTRRIEIGQPVSSREQLIIFGQLLLKLRDRVLKVPHPLHGCEVSSPAQAKINSKDSLQKLLNMTSRKVVYASKDSNQSSQARPATRFIFL